MHPFIEDDPHPHIQQIHKLWDIGLAKLDPTEAELQRGLELHRDAVAIDTFGFLPMVWTDQLVVKMNQLVDDCVGKLKWHFESVLLRQAAAAEDANGPGGKAFRASIKASGLNGMVQTVGRALIPGMFMPEYDMRAIAGFNFICRTFNDCVVQTSSADHLKAEAQRGRFGVVFSTNSPPVPGRMIDIEDESSWLKPAYYFGFRLVHLSYNRRNIVADGGVEGGGLSQFGQELVPRLNEVGLIIDTPHSSKQTTLEAAKLTNKPMMASHVGCAALFEHHRNKDDEQLRAIADTGGMVGIVSLPTFLGGEGDINTLIDHIDHAVKTIGADHVGIGTDTNISTPWPDAAKPHPGRMDSRWPGGWAPTHGGGGAKDEARTGSLAWSNWPLFTVGMVKRGFTDDDIRKILGLNLLRVMKDNEPG